MASSVAETSLRPFEGPLPLFSVLMLQQQTYFPSPFYERTPCRIFFPPGCRQLSLPFSLCLFFFFPFHFHFYCHSMSPILFLLLFTNFFSFPLFPAIWYRFLDCPSCATQDTSPIPLYLSLVPRDYIPPPQICVTELLIVLIYFLL